MLEYNGQSFYNFFKLVNNNDNNNNLFLRSLSIQTLNRCMRTPQSSYFN
jgi:hypothetical protein